MPLRRIYPLLKTEPEPIADGPGQSSPTPDHKNIWRTGLLLATSAALGGIAVAIWNRRTLAQMRQQDPDTED